MIYTVNQFFFYIIIEYNTHTIPGTWRKNGSLDYIIIFPTHAYHELMEFETIGHLLRKNTDDDEIKNTGTEVKLNFGAVSRLPFSQKRRLRRL